MGRTTIFNQLVLNIVLPVMAVLVGLAIVNYYQTNELLTSTYKNKNEIISKEIHNILRFQDFSLEMIESNLDSKISNYSNSIVKDHLGEDVDPKTLDLDKISEDLGMADELSDIYIIDKTGEVINTTYTEDLGRNIYEFGEEYKKLLESQRLSGKLHLERFSVEASSRKLKKYSYHGTIDHEYIVEIGYYSENANQVLNQFNDQLESMANRHKSITQVDLFIGEKQPVSFNPKSDIDQEHLENYRGALNNKMDAEVKVDIEGGHLYYEYIYMTRKNSNLYKNSIIRLISDRSEDERNLRNKLLTLLAEFGVVILILIVMIVFRSKIIAGPIINLVDKAHKIQKGDLSERVEVSGNNEITTLSESFNSMLSQLEESYNGLEQKVASRTAELSEINKKITDSIFYAKRIQTAILPSDNELDELFKENFVLFKPMTIVSGDFYWVSKKDNKVLISAADCTGHGVPGAFMSMIGNTLLNKIVNENNITQPNNILFQLREEIIESLNQAKDDNLSKDGMDMTICAIDFETNILEFSGANNPLVIIRKGEVIEYKGNKQPVGMLMGELQPFTNHEIKIEKDDMIYLFSDGFQDQFGGPEDRKFMKKRFKALLEEIATKPVSEQHDILDHTINDWIKNTRQIDDILVMGIRV